ncbi:hypothetical protein ALC62_14714 [Cyphomyrmex costatus]|uniref:Uncharacterized protein n=1 Tax=Cyphomyrmex costatus TaxID=456900 RepID=A0A195C3H9_9HYME|nr:hypothetical protein ALC62_14714 [Cyphomyrmex costatus]
MEMIATANVMRMRPGDGIASGGAGATGLDDGEKGLQRGNEDEGAWRAEAKRTFGFFRADRSQLIITLRPSESSERLTGCRIPLREVTLTKLQRK